MLQLSSWR